MIEIYCQKNNTSIEYRVSRIELGKKTREKRREKNKNNKYFFLFLTTALKFILTRNPPICRLTDSPIYRLVYRSASLNQLAS